SHQVQPDDGYRTVAVKRTTIQPRFPEAVFVYDWPDDELDGSSHDPAPAQRISGEVGEVEEGVAPAVMPREPVTVLRPESTEVKNRIPHAKVEIPKRLFTSAGSSSSFAHSRLTPAK
ncbi:hypothetical protein, partial [Candidatus Regiella insecticola]|uniref:hypothetical protein n=1 Tax=Candidatus Regiella insecticola TaxID=138073 RepID=UPI000586DEBB